MLSRKFSKITNNEIIDFLTDDSCKSETADFIDSIKSVSDLWALANIKKTYDEENIINNSFDSGLCITM